MANANGRGRGRGPWVVVAAAASLLVGIGIGALWPRPGAGGAAAAPRAAPCDPASPAGTPVDGPDHPPALDDLGRTRQVEGPWGQLRYVGLWLFPPLQNVNPAHCLDLIPPWQFPGLTRGDLERLLSVPDLPAPARDAVLREARCDAGGCRVQPTREMAAGLSPTARSRIYGLQVQQPGNEWGLFTQRLSPADFDLWLAQSDLPEAVVARIRGLSFPLGVFRAVADLPLLCAEAPDADAKGRLFRAWSFDRALLAKIRVQKGQDDPDRLVEWWARGKRRKDLKELFTAAVRSDEVASIDVAHLLPFWVRALLNTYPMPDDPPYNCYWSAVNFRRGSPDPTPLEASDLEAALARDFVPVTDGSRMLGDVVLYETPEGMTIHAAVHVADGIAFTKNGGSNMKPWILAREIDLDALYGSREGSRRRIYRPRGW